MILRRSSSDALLASLLALASCACGANQSLGRATAEGGAGTDGSLGSGGTRLAGSGGAAAMTESGGAPSETGGTGGMRADASAAVDAQVDGANELPSSTFVYVGSGDAVGGHGAIGVYRWDGQARALTHVNDVPAGALASFLAIDEAHSALYQADEGDGNLRRFDLDPASHVPFGAKAVGTAGHPVFVTTTKDGRFVLVAHFNEGKVETFGVADGVLGSSLDVESPGSEAHAIILSPDERFAFVPCRGADEIVRYHFDATTGMLATVAPPVLLQAKDGPRHLVFHPNRALAYLVNELSSTVVAYAYDASAGSLTELDRKSLLPIGFAGTSTAAELALNPSGSVLYVTDRIAGQDGTLTAFLVGKDGRLTFVARKSTGGQTPRSFAMDPSGRFVFVGNQDGNSLAVFASDGVSGALGTPSVKALGATAYFVGAAAFGNGTGSHSN
jgi:6-phosphogluconolactonase